MYLVLLKNLIVHLIIKFQSEIYINENISTLYITNYRITYAFLIAFGTIETSDRTLPCLSAIRTLVIKNINILYIIIANRRQGSTYALLIIELATE